MRHLSAFLLALLPAMALAQGIDTGSAADSAATAPGSSMMSLLPLFLIFFIFYFMLIKPQQKRMKEHQSLIAGIKKGDEVITGGGIIGKVTKAGADDTVTVEIAKGVEVVVAKGTISGLVTVKSPVQDKKKGNGNKNDNVLPSKSSVANDN